MNNNNKALKYLYICLGFFITSYIIYIRVFLVRIPKDLNINYCNEDYNIKITLILLSILICVYVLINNIKIELNIKKKQNILSNILNFLIKTIENSLIQFFAFILSFYENRYDLISNCSKKFYAKFGIYPEYYLLFAIYTIRGIILTIFLFEVFFNFKLNYFYKSLILLCIVLFIKFSINVLRDFASNVESYKEILIIEDNGIDKETQLPIISYSLKPEYSDNTDYELPYIIEEFIICNKLTGYLEMYDRYNKFFNAKFNIIVYSFYLIGWLYILYVNLMLYLF